MSLSKALSKISGKGLSKSSSKQFAPPQPQSKSRIAWLEGVRMAAAVMILLYHAQLMLTNYAYTPQPTGWLENWRSLTAANDRLGLPSLLTGLTLPAWFGYQFVDVFVLISGFSLVLSLQGKPLSLINFLKQRFSRILFPFWAVVWLSYPVLWLVGTATQSYIPHPWHVFAAATFPLLFDYAGNLLLAMSGPWWFVSLILSFTLVFPFLWQRLQQWGAKNLLLVSLAVTIAYRAAAVYWFGGHPTYVILDTPANSFPFIAFVAKLSTFVGGMVAATEYQRGRGVLKWRSSIVLLLALPTYAVGFISQFYRAGWIVADLLTPIGLMLLCLVLFRWLERFKRLDTVMIWLGSHSYTYFLLHNFVVDRTLNLWVKGDWWRYHCSLPLMIAATLLLSLLVDALTPLFQRGLSSTLKAVDLALSSPTAPASSWSRSLSDRWSA